MYSIAGLDIAFALYSKHNGKTESVSREEWVVRNQCIGENGGLDYKSRCGYEKM